MRYSGGMANDEQSQSKYPPVRAGQVRVRYSILGTQYGSTVVLAGWIDLSRAPLTNDEADALAARLERLHNMNSATLLGWNEVQR